MPLTPSFPLTIVISPILAHLHLLEFYSTNKISFINVAIKCISTTKVPLIPFVEAVQRTVITLTKERAIAPQCPTQSHSRNRTTFHSQFILFCLFLFFIPITPFQSAFLGNVAIPTPKPLTHSALASTSIPTLPHHHPQCPPSHPNLPSSLYFPYKTKP